MRSEAYIANFELSTYFRGVVVLDHYKRQLFFFKALSSQQKNAIGCHKLEGTCESLIKAFKVYDVSCFNAFIERTSG